MVRAVEAAGATAVARVENVEASHILQYVDRGIQGIMGPHIASGEDAEKLVDACYFGPIGHRSFGGNRGTNYSFTPDAWGDKRDFYQQANDNMIVGALLGRPRFDRQYRRHPSGRRYPLLRDRDERLCPRHRLSGRAGAS